MYKKPVFHRTALLAAVLSATSVLSPVFAQTANTAVAPTAIPLGSLAEIGVVNSTYGTGAAGAASFMGENFGIRLAADSAGKSDHLLGAVGIAVNNQGYLVFGGSVGNEPISGFDSKVKGNSAFVRLDMTNLTPAVRKVFLEVISKHASGKTLSVVDTPFTTVTTQDLGTVIRTTTINGVQRTTFSFTGGNANSIGLGGEANVGSDGMVTIKVFHVRSEMGDETSSKTFAWAGYKQYFPQLNANVGVGGDTDGRLTASAEKGFEGTAFGLNLTGFKNTKGAKDYGVLFGVNYAFGGTTANVGKRPDSNAGQLAETLKGFNTLSNYAVRNVEGMGKVVQTKEIISAQTVSDAAKPAAPVAPVVVPNTAPTALSFAQSLTLNAGVTASGQALGKVACVDYSPTGAQNTCTFTGGNTNFAVAADGTVTFISASAPQSASVINPQLVVLVPSLTQGNYSVPVVAKDAAGLTYTGTVTVVVGAALLANNLSITNNDYGCYSAGNLPHTFQFTYSTSSSGAITWSSSRPTDISVSATGLATFLVPFGWTRITATQAATSTYKEVSNSVYVGCSG